MIPAKVLALVPGCADHEPPLDVVALPGGEGRNLVLRIHTREGLFVWRRRLPPVDRPGALARTELQAHRLAAAAGLAPRVLHAAPDGSWLLMEHVDAPRWRADQLCSAHGAERIGLQLARLHALDSPASVPVADPVAMTEGYRARIAGRDPAAAASLQPLATRIAELGRQIAEQGEARVLVHGDLMVSNMLGPQPLLVDWEYAQAADPAWDWACLLSYYPALGAWTDRLLGAAAQDTPTARARLQLQQQRFALLTSLWQRAYPALS